AVLEHEDAGEDGSPEPEPEPAPEAPVDETEPTPEDIPVDDDLVEDEPEIEDEPVREIVVDSSALGKSGVMDVFTHAGGRTIIGKAELHESGTTSVGEALDRAPGVRAVDGNSGLGSQDTKLQVGVRGVNPRLSSRATVLLDEIPIAPAPYGQPQLSLFPLSIFSISKIDAIRGGVAARYGPQTSGGVFNLISNPIPLHPSVSAFTQFDSNLDAGLGLAYGATHGRFGMYFEYAPRFGRSWREHSDKIVHGGLAKFEWRFKKPVKISSLTHGFYEDSELPGGIDREAYDEDPFQSTRPFDYFRGQRVGTSLALDWQPNERQDFDIAGWYAHTFRTTYLASNATDERTLVDTFQRRPRTYDVMGIEPRWAIRWNHERIGVSQQLSLGGRAAYEIAKMYTYVEQFGIEELTADDDGRTAAYAGYVTDKLIFLDGDLTLEAGLRIEYIQLARRSNLERRALRRNYWAPLPAASLWYAPLDELALFLSYGRSFGSPQYLQVIVSSDVEQLAPETSNSVEFGAKVLEVGGIYGESTLWYKEFTNFIDVGEESFDNIPKIHIWGVESEVYWYPGEVWDMPGELELYVGYGWTDSYIIGGQEMTGNEMPWYPKHEAWAGSSYSFDFGLGFGVDVSYMGKQYTDYQNREDEDGDTAAYGPIPDYTLVNVWARMQTPLPRGWRLEFTGGVKNVGDVRYFSRTDDRNAGILVGRPRTFYFNVGFAHDFLPKHMREPRRERKRKAGRSTARVGDVEGMPPV
ncbi:MAG: TonB-dependent receptor, partial [Deltaproteobacteria bacterium]|nr:TonB-dependent receptor [Deltaproteobacteria bacterium]